MRIGILGGTFDPPHHGHLALAKAALEQLDLDEVMLMPANRNPLKSRRVETSADDRIGMIEAMIKGENDARLSTSDLEITRGGQSYAVDTLTELHMARPAEYWFLLGSDAIRSIEEWKQPQRLIRLCRLGLAVRPPATPDQVRSRIPEPYVDAVDFVNMQPLNISSSDLRDRISLKKPVTDLIPSEVIKYIQRHRLYT